MKKQELTNSVNSCKLELRKFLTEILSLLNHGQRNKILQNESFKQICERYGMEVDDEP